VKKSIRSRIRDFFIDILPPLVELGIRIVVIVVTPPVRAWRWAGNLLRRMLGIESPSGGWAQKIIVRDKKIHWRVRLKAWWSPSYALSCVGKYYIQPGLLEGLNSISPQGKEDGKEG